ncbi:hypothetical protein KGQ34_03695 [Patescibacteria group bacterium]|nr:hypothetical protein [Patescibacteria group bacterium]
MKNNILKNAFFNASATALYIAAVASFLFYVPKFFGHRTDIMLVPMVMLSLFVFSAALTGSLIFGKPILWYLEGKKQEAISLLVVTLGIFLAITVAAFFALFVYYYATR